MNGTLIPIAWRTFSSSIGPVPVAWGGFLDGQYVEVWAYSG